MGPKVVQRLSGIGILVFFLFSAVAGAFLAEVTLHPSRRVETADDETRVREMCRRQDSEVMNVAVRSQDGVNLRAWSIRSRRNHGNVVILLHGLGDNRSGMTGYAELLLNHGFNVLMPDSRAHGTSGGALATFGLLEMDDIHRWLNWLEQNDNPACIFGLGESMGAALLLQSLRGESRFCAVAAESSFSSFREIAYDRVGQFFGTGSWLGRTVLRPVVESAFAYARWKYRLNFEQVSPDESIAVTKIPVLLIHGESDRNIPVRHSRLIVAHNPAVVLWTVPLADHCGAVGTAPQEFSERLFRWFGSHAQKNALAAAH